MEPIFPSGFGSIMEGGSSSIPSESEYQKKLQRIEELNKKIESVKRQLENKKEVADQKKMEEYSLLREEYKFKRDEYNSLLAEKLNEERMNKLSP